MALGPWGGQGEALYREVHLQWSSYSHSFPITPPPTPAPFLSHQVSAG